MNSRLWLFFAGILGATGVAMGAFQAHGLEKMLLSQELDPADISHRLELCGTAVRFQLTHALALIGIAILARLQRDEYVWSSIGTVFLVGTLLFSGALYGIAVFDMKQVSHVAPGGGITLIVAWLMLAFASFWFVEKIDD